MDAARAADHTSLCAQVCTEELWNKYKDTVSSGPAKWTLARAINTGVIYPHSFVGCHAGDMESYDDFKEFFYPVIQKYHKGFDINTTKHVCDMDPAKITVELSPSAQSKIISTRIRVARNFSMFPLNPYARDRYATAHYLVCPRSCAARTNQFTPPPPPPCDGGSMISSSTLACGCSSWRVHVRACRGGTVETRCAITDMMEKVYGTIPTSSPLKGSIFRHTTMSDEQRQGLIDGELNGRPAQLTQTPRAQLTETPRSDRCQQIISCFVGRIACKLLQGTTRVGPWGAASSTTTRRRSSTGSTRVTTSASSRCRRAVM
jgi:hypothetical protein